MSIFLLFLRYATNDACLNEIISYLNGWKTPLFVLNWTQIWHQFSPIRALDNSPPFVRNEDILTYCFQTALNGLLRTDHSFMEGMKGTSNKGWIGLFVCLSSFYVLLRTMPLKNGAALTIRLALQIRGQTVNVRHRGGSRHSWNCMGGTRESKMMVSNLSGETHEGSWLKRLDLYLHWIVWKHKHLYRLELNNRLHSMHFCLLCMLYCMLLTTSTSALRLQYQYQNACN